MIRMSVVQAPILQQYNCIIFLEQISETAFQASLLLAFLDDFERAGNPNIPQVCFLMSSLDEIIFVHDVSSNLYCSNFRCRFVCCGLGHLF